MINTKCTKAVSLTLFFVFVQFINVCFSQITDSKRVQEMFNQGMYIQAFSSYEKMLISDPTNGEYLYRAAYCLLNINGDRKKALIYLEKAVNQLDDPEVTYQTGKAYMLNYKFDQAIKYFNDYKKIGGSSDLKQVDKDIADCYKAKELMNFPVEVEFKNLGSKINSPYMDYYPFVSKEDNLLVFTSRRRENRGQMDYDGYYPSDIWVSARSKTTKEWQKAKSAGIVNTAFDESAVGLSDDGKQMFVYSHNPKTKESKDIFVSEKVTSSFGKMQVIPEGLNSKYLESSGSLSSDEQVMFFASNRPGGKGGLDIYMTRKLPNGKWALPQNLGNNINTEFDEDFPTLSFDNKTLFFSSKGHPGMGGFDLYKSEWNRENNTWTIPVNLGYPINSPENERSICFVQDHSKAYLAALRPEGMGNLDIYEVKYTDAIKPAIFKLELYTEDKTIKITDAFVTIINENGETIGDYAPNQNTGIYSLILKPGKYKISVDAVDYSLLEEDFIVKDFHTELPFITKIITLSP